MSNKYLATIKTEQYKHNKMFEIELARIQETQEIQELAATETAVNIDYLVCLQDMNI